MSDGFPPNFEMQCLSCGEEKAIAYFMGQLIGRKCFKKFMGMSFERFKKEINDQLKKDYKEVNDGI